MALSLLDITPRVAELGRIRLGEKGPKGEPRRLGTFRLTSGSLKLLEAAASLYGGKPRPWAGAPDVGFFELTTTVAELDILVPHMDAEQSVISQAYELWQGGTCERRCDGRFESVTRVACLCDPDARECDIITRFNVMLPRVPGLGVWRLDTGGWQAATTLPATLGLLSQLSTGRWIPAVLRAEQGSKRVRENGEVVTHRFVVPRLDLPGMTIGQLVESAGLAPLPQIEAEARPAQPTARERVAAMAAARAPDDSHAGAGASSPAPAPIHEPELEPASSPEAALPARSAASGAASPDEPPLPPEPPGEHVCGALSTWAGSEATCTRPTHGERVKHSNGRESW